MNTDEHRSLVELDPFVGEPVRVGAAEALFALGDRVRAVIGPPAGDPPDAGFVVAIQIMPGGFIYWVQWPRVETKHYAFELIAEED